MLGSTSLLPLAALALSSIAQASPHHAEHQLAHAKRFGKVVRNNVHHGAPIEERSNVSSGLAVREGDETKRLSKRDFSGRATFFAPGLGACGTYSGAGDYVRFLPVTWLQRTCSVRLSTGGARASLWAQGTPRLS